MNETSVHDTKTRYNILFDSVEDSLVDNAIESTTELVVPAGTAIFEDDSEGSSLYLLLAGTVRIAKRAVTGEETLLGILHAGDFFGELELIDSRSRSARAIAMTECRLSLLKKEEFERLLQESPQFARNLMRILSLRLRSSNQLYMQQLHAHVEAAQRHFEKMHRLIEATKSVNSSLKIDDLLDIILRTATDEVRADRGTVYLVDESTKELWSKVYQGSDLVEIRLQIGKGIAGYVAASGETLNIGDAYADPRFNPEVDKASGYKTRNILSMPMRDRNRKIIGVFQLLNKENGLFTREDQEYLEAISVPASIAIENARLAQEMVQHERLSAVGKMASTIIHDIKNPLGALRLSAQIMKSKSADKQIGTLADGMISQVDRFVAMTQEILDFSRGVSTLNLQQINFAEFVETLLTLVENELGSRKIVLKKEISFEGMVTIDPDKIARTFYNILGNAMDAMPKGGTIMLDASSDGDMLSISFKDTGSGMPPAIKAKIFEPFLTHGKRHGTGLGMAIVKRIIDDHKGSIVIDSQEGKGTTVIMLLPL